MGRKKKAVGNSTWGSHPTELIHPNVLHFQEGIFYFNGSVRVPLVSWKQRKPLEVPLWACTILLNRSRLLLHHSLCGTSQGHACYTNIMQLDV